MVTASTICSAACSPRASGEVALSNGTAFDPYTAWKTNYLPNETFQYSRVAKKG